MTHEPAHCHAVQEGLYRIARDQDEAIRNIRQLQAAFLKVTVWVLATFFGAILVGLGTLVVSKLSGG